MNKKKLPPVPIRRLELPDTLPDNESVYKFIMDNVIKKETKDVTVQTVKDRLKKILPSKFHMLYVSRRVCNEYTEVTDSFLQDPSLEDILQNSLTIAEDNDQDSGDEDSDEDEDDETEPIDFNTPGTDLRVDVMLLFIRITPKGPDVFVATSGYAYRIIKDEYWDMNFPNTIAKRTLEFSLKDLSTHNLIGSTISETKSYRTGHEAQPTLWSFFGCIKVSYTMPLREDSSLYNLKCFQTKTGCHKRINVVVGKNYLKFKVKLDISFLSKLINNLSDILYDNNLQGDQRFSVFEHVILVRDPVLIQQAKTILMEQLNSHNTPPNLELAYKNYTVWNEVSEVKLVHKEECRKYNLLEILHNTPCLLQNALNVVKTQSMMKSLDSLYIEFTHTEGRNIREPFLNLIEGHIMTESGMSVFRHGGKWMQISCEYMMELEEEFCRINNSYCTPTQNILPLPWVVFGKDGKFSETSLDTWLEYWTDNTDLHESIRAVLVKLHTRAFKRQTEGDYNEGYIMFDEIVRTKYPDTGYLLGDKILTTKVELFDILYYTPDKTYLIHVKDGFGAMTRNVCSQIRVSADLLFKHLVSKDGLNILREFWRNVHSDNETLSDYRHNVRKMYEKFGDFDAFALLFQREIIFVLAYKDPKQPSFSERETCDPKRKIEEVFGKESDMIFKILKETSYFSKHKVTDKVMMPKAQVTQDIKSQLSQILKTLPSILSEELMQRFNNLKQDAVSMDDAVEDIIGILMPKLATALSILKGVLSGHKSIVAKLEILNLFYHFQRFVTPKLRFELQICSINQLDPGWVPS